jgi:hypothetical protein
MCLRTWTEYGVPKINIQGRAGLRLHHLAYFVQRSEIQAKMEPFASCGKVAFWERAYGVDEEEESTGRGTTEQTNRQRRGGLAVGRGKGAFGRGRGKGKCRHKEGGRGTHALLLAFLPYTCHLLFVCCGGSCTMTYGGESGGQRPTLGNDENICQELSSPVTSTEQ